MYSPRAMTSRLPRLDRSIVLVGLMGVGKSTIGRRLAKRLGLEFVDSDTEIELAAGYTIVEIFERFGEASFRDGERRVITRLVEGKPKVIATGGGAFVNDSTRALLNEKCITVWLDAPVDLLTERTARRPETRPMLTDATRAETLARLIEKRRPAYAQAHIRVASEAGAHGEVVERIVAAIDRHLGENK